MRVNRRISFRINIISRLLNKGVFFVVVALANPRSNGGREDDFVDLLIFEVAESLVNDAIQLQLNMAPEWGVDGRAQTSWLDRFRGR
jgi:hypothetical protein